MPPSRPLRGMSNSKAVRSEARQTRSQKACSKGSVYMLYMCSTVTWKLPFNSMRSFRLSNRVYFFHLPTEKQLK